MDSVRLALAALALASVATVVVARRGSCDTCGSYLCVVNVAGLER